MPDSLIADPMPSGQRGRDWKDLSALHRQIPVDDFRSDGVVREPAGDAERRVVNALHDTNNLSLAAQDDVVLRLTLLLDGNQKFALQSFEGREGMVRNTEESLTADVFRFRFRPGSLAGTIEPQGVRQPQATAATAIWRIIG